MADVALGKEGVRGGRIGLFSMMMASFLTGHPRGNEILVKSLELDDIKQSLKASVLGTGSTEMKWMAPPSSKELI